MQIAIYSRPKISPELIYSTNLLISELKKAEAEVFLYQPFYDKIKTKLTDRNQKTFEKGDIYQFSCLVTLGGDGTILDAVELVKRSGVPVLGINLGRLGFLAAIAPADIPAAVQQLCSGEYTIDARSLVALQSNKTALGQFPFALNECTIQKRDTSAMITIHAYLNGELLNSYWADGLIIATPTGSTGYSMSCGGPILLPTAQNLVITPIAAHNLNVRPIAIPDDAKLHFEVTHRDKDFLLTLDSRTQVINTSFELHLQKADFTFNLIRFKPETFINALHSKLYWGFDKRN